MAGLLDFLMPRGQGMIDFGTDPGQAPQGLFGLDQNALLLGGMGMLGNGWQGALQGVMAGRKQAAEQEAARQFQAMLPQMLGMPGPDQGAVGPGEFRGGSGTPGMQVPGAFPMPGAQSPMVPPQVPSAPPGAMPPAGPPMTQARPPVPPTAKVWGDAEAERAGLYEPQKPAAPASRPTAPAMTFKALEPRVPYLAIAMANPNLPAPQRELAKVLLTNALEDRKLTEQQKNWIFDTQQRVAAGQQPLTFSQFAHPSKIETVGEDRFGRPQRAWVSERERSISPLNGQQPSGQPGAEAPAQFVTTLRKEIQDIPSYKNIAAAAPIYNSMKEAVKRDTRAADVNMIYGLAKIMDPTSVVRESEMTIAQAVATLPQYIRANIESQLAATGRLSPDVREAIMQEAYSRVNAYKEMFGRDAGMYRGVAGRFGVNPADILPDFGTFEPFTMPKAATPPTPSPLRIQPQQQPQPGQWLDLGNGIRIRPKAQ